MHSGIHGPPPIGSHTPALQHCVASLQHITPQQEKPGPQPKNMKPQVPPRQLGVEHGSPSSGQSVGMVHIIPLSTPASPPPSRPASWPASRPASEPASRPAS